LATLHSTYRLVADEVPSSYKIVGVQFIRQQKMWCGVASLTMVLNYWGDQVTQDTVGLAINPQHVTIPGSRLVEYAKGRGFDVVTYSRLSSIDELKKWISKDYPVIVFQYVGLPGYGTEGHFRVVIGYDDSNSTVYIIDPAFEYIQFSYEKFIEIWRTKYSWGEWKGDGWAMIAIPTMAFGIEVSPSTIEIEQGSSASFNVSISLVSGLPARVELILTGLPVNATYEFKPSYGRGTFTSNLTVTTTSKTPIGTYALTIKGICGTKSATTSVELTVKQR